MSRRHHGGFGAVVGVEFEEDIADMVFDGLLTDEEGLGDFTVALAGGDLLEDFDLPVGQFRKQFIIGGALYADSVEFRQNAGGNAWMQTAAAFRNGMNGGDGLFDRTVFQHIPVG